MYVLTHLSINSVIAVNYGYQEGFIADIYRKTFDPQQVETYQKYSMPHDSFGNITSLNVSKSADGSSYSSGRTLTSYTYDTNVSNGNLIRMTYGNGAYIDYSYDKFDRETELRYSDGSACHYVYNAEGDLAQQYETNSSGTIVRNYYFEYDSLDRLIRSIETSATGAAQRTEHIYDNADRLTSQSWQIGNDSFSESYTYDLAGGKLSSMTTASGAQITLGYDALKRLSTETTTVDGSTLFTKNYTYRDSTTTAGRTTLQPTDVKYTRNGTSLADYTYTYNSAGNIASETDTGTGVTTAYTYGTQNELLTATLSSGTTYTYTYDTAGNILTASNGSTTHTYSYNDADWADLLTSYDGHNLSYDAIGNPTSYYNGKSYTMSWEKGRRLSATTTGGVTASYEYDIDGIRRSKTVGDLETEYVTQNGLVVRQTENNNTLDFIYDAQQHPYAVIWRTGVDEPETYYYILNQQGDIKGLVNSSGSVVALYEYDPWGKVLSVTNSSGNTLTSGIGVVNPLRYRGYYYDAETGFYYLQSRYYDPGTGRFINADTAEYSALAAVDINGTNLFV